MRLQSYVRGWRHALNGQRRPAAKRGLALLVCLCALSVGMLLGCEDESQRAATRLRADPELSEYLYVPSNADQLRLSPPGKGIHPSVRSLSYILNEPYPATKYLAGLREHFRRLGWHCLRVDPSRLGDPYGAISDKEPDYFTILARDCCGLWEDCSPGEAPTVKYWSNWWTDGKSRIITVCLAYDGSNLTTYPNLSLYKGAFGKALIRRYAATFGPIWEGTPTRGRAGGGVR